MKDIKDVSKNKNGITLIALVVTIIVLLILAGITIITLYGDNGVINKANTANEKTKIAKARERLELTLTDAGIEKRINKEYNQNEYLDKLIKDKIPGSKINDDIAIVDGYAFELDRAVPKIGKYIDRADNLEFPEIRATATLNSDYKSSTITIVAKEETNGISKIEIIQGGFVIKEYKYSNKTEPITETFNVTQNGEYIVKAYSKLNGTEAVNVNGIIMSIQYTPNGNSTYKREHEVTVKAEEAGEKVKSIKYQWLNTTVQPSKESFSDTVANGEKVTKNKVTGQWYLWTLLETESGKTSIQRSEAFYFDNEGPTVNITSTPVSEIAFTLLADATDDKVDIAKYEYYVNGVLKETKLPTDSDISCKVTDAQTGDTECYVVVTDTLGNQTTKTVTGKTKLYTWEVWDTKPTYTFIFEETDTMHTFTANTLYFGIYFDEEQQGFCTPRRLTEVKKGDVENLRKHIGEYMYDNGSTNAYLGSRGWRLESISNDYWPVARAIDAKRQEVLGKGDNKEDTDATGTRRNQYPDDAVSGTKYYIYKGVY